MKSTLTLVVAFAVAAGTLVKADAAAPAKEGAAATPGVRKVPVAAPETPPSKQAEPAGQSAAAETTEKQVASLKPDEIKEFSVQPPKVQAVLREALALTERNLVYLYGSDDPAKGGMDCSGFVSYVLQQAGYSEVPRECSGQYLWVRKHNEFHGLRSQDPDALAAVQPGDLLFWSGTYTIKRDVPITHVMIYLGTSKQSGKPLMVGASEGRSYAGVRRFGVSVFDFKLPTGQPANDDPGRTPKFEGFATIPGLRPGDLVDNETAAGHARVQPSPIPRHRKPLSDGD
jgi:cell wall-associated NlpC family hydrolase